MRNNTTFSYEILWRASLTALDMATVEDPRIRVDHLSIHSILTAFLAFEGFINFVGDEIASETWRNEKEFFSKSDFKGIIGKLEYLFTLFPDAKLIKGEEPYQTFIRVKNIRDNLAHNRVLHYSETTPDTNPSLRTAWENFDTPEKIRPALVRLQEFAEIIRLQAVKLLIEDCPSHLHHRALEGPLGNSNGTRTLGSG